MSGAATGIILLGAFVFPAIVSSLGVASDVASKKASRRSSQRFEQNQRNNRNFNNHYNNPQAQLNQSGIYQNMNSLKNQMQNHMQEQTRLNMAASERMMQELDKTNAQMLAAAQQGDVGSWKKYMQTLSQNRTATMNQVYAIQNEFNQNYQKSISQSMNQISSEINQQYHRTLNELQQLNDNTQAKQKLASELAKSYLEEAKSLFHSLEHEFEGRKFSPRETGALLAQLNKVIMLYQNQHYEAAIAGAKDSAVQIMEEIYRADAKKQEWENYYKTSLVLSDSIKEYLVSSEYFTEEMKKQAEAKLKEELPCEMAGVRLADYTAKNKNGQNKYDFLRAKSEEIYQALRSDDARKLSTEQLKNYIDFINAKLYPESAETIGMAVLNMNNAFARQTMSEEIIDFFEEHNFTFDGYAYEEKRHDGALHIGLKNEAAGEEIMITLAPEVVNGEIQTKVDINQTAGDEANEERKQYYRDGINKVITKNLPDATVDLHCCQETFGKLSSDTAAKAKIEQAKAENNG